jgi:hypothetical protein
MDATHFDRLVQSFAGAGSRRGLLRLLAILPVSGAATTFLASDSEAAKRRHRTKQHHRDDHQQLQAQRKKNKKKCAQAGQATSKKRKACCTGLVRDASGVCSSVTPPSPPASPPPPPPPPPPPGCTPATCAPNACGSVPDGCGGTLSCGGCAGNSLCVSGTCEACDVCPSGCLFTTIDQAMAAANSGETIHVCPGLYTGNLDIHKNLTLIGAGDGNGAGSTILQGIPAKLSVMTVATSTSVNLQRLRITGGDTTTNGTAPLAGGITNFGILALTGCTISGNIGGLGGGIFHSGGNLTLTDCTVAGNTGKDGGGILAIRPLALISSTISGNKATEAGGGILIKSRLTLDAASRVVGNTAPTTPGSGGGIHNGGTVTLSNTDNVSGNTPDNCAGPTPVPLCNG